MKITTKGSKTRTVKKLIYDILDILEAVNIPMNDTDRRKEKMACACLAVANISKSFSEAESYLEDHFLTSRQIIEYENSNFKENISSGSYDDIRRKDLVLLVEAGLVINSSTLDSAAVNCPTRGYAITPDFAELIKSYNTPNWNDCLKSFLVNHKHLKEELERKRNLEKIPVTLPSGQHLNLSSGQHNVLQKKIIEKFLPIFGMGAEVLYVGDTSDKYLLKDDKTLKSLGFFKLEHEELPDIVAYTKDKNLLYLIEAVHSNGPMSEIRVRKLKKQLEGCTANIVYFTAFLDKKTFRTWATDIAWETEVWIAENPEHLIHFNGYKFLEIHK